MQQLREGRGKLMAEVNTLIDELRQAGSISTSAQPVIIVVPASASRERGLRAEEPAARRSPRSWEFRFRAALNRQNIGVIPSATITSRDWRALPGEGISDGPAISVRGGLAATLSVTVQGGPAQFQILLEDVSKNFKEILMTPRSVSFDPGTGTESFSYTFVRGLHPGGYTVNFYWRSPAGVPVTETRGTLVLQYATKG